MNIDGSTVALCGLSGCGKSTLGAWLATELGYTFTDLDQFIEAEQGFSISQIFADKGEEYFRRLEEQALSFLLNNPSKNQVIALGGGTVLSPVNQQVLLGHTVIFINRSVEAILSTLNTQNRPLLKANPQRLYQHYNDRYPIYKKIATHQLENDGILEEVKQRLLQLLGAR